jgi:hypothetical protein
MNRRSFLQTSAVGTAAVLTVPAMTVFTAGCSTSWITTVENDIPVIVGIANSILEVISIATGSGAIAAAVGAIVTDAVNALSASLSALQDAVLAYQASTGTGLTKVIAALLAAQADVQKVVASLPAGSVSTVVETVIIAGIGTVITILSGIQSLIPGAATASVTAKAVSAVSKSTVTPPNAATLKAGFDLVLINYGFSAAS